MLLPRINLPKLSEKGYEQCADFEFGQYPEGEMDRNPFFSDPQGHAASVSSTFSDSFSTHSGE
jgi:hypothetical protein